MTELEQQVSESTLDLVATCAFGLEAIVRRELEALDLPATIGNPGRKQEIMDTLFKTATDQDDPKHVAAAKQYFEIEGSMKPQEHKVRIERDPKELSDEELEKAIAARVVQLNSKKAG